jgi:acyl carrier protein
MRKQEQVLRLVADALVVALEQLSPSSTASDFKEWDSMGTMNIMILLDSEMGIRLAPGESERLQSVAGILSLVERAETSA